jgi:hypothetical protein
MYASKILVRVGIQLAPRNSLLHCRDGNFLLTLCTVISANGMSGIRPALCLLCLLHKENNNHNVLSHEDILHFICNEFCLKFLSAHVLSFLCVVRLFLYTVSWNFSCYLRRMLMHVNFKCYELSTFSFSCLIVVFTRVNGCWRQRCQCLGREGEEWLISLPHNFFYSCSDTVGNVVSEWNVIREYLDLRKIKGVEKITKWGALAFRFFRIYI